MGFLETLFSDEFKSEVVEQLQTAVTRELSEQLGNKEENLQPRAGVAPAPAASSFSLSPTMIGVGAVAAVGAYIALRK